MVEKKKLNAIDIQVLPCLDGNGFVGAGKVRVITYVDGKVTGSCQKEIKTNVCRSIFEAFVQLGEEMFRIQLG